MDAPDDSDSPIDVTTFDPGARDLRSLGLPNRRRAAVAAAAVAAAGALLLVIDISYARWSAIGIDPDMLLPPSNGLRLAAVTDWLTGIQLAAWLFAGIAFVVWLRGTVIAIERLEQIRVSPGRTAALLSWFVPIMSCFVPYLIVRNSLLALGDGVERRARRVVIIWWVAYVIGGPIRLLAAFSDPSSSLAVPLRLVALAVDTLSVALAIVVIAAVQARSDARFRAVAALSDEEDAGALATTATTPPAAAGTGPDFGLAHQRRPFRAGVVAGLLTLAVALPATFFLPDLIAPTDGVSSTRFTSASGVTLEYPGWMWEVPKQRIDNATELLLASDARSNGSGGAFVVFEMDVDRATNMQDFAAAMSAMSKPTDRVELVRLPTGPAVHFLGFGATQTLRDEGYGVLWRGKLTFVAITAHQQDLPGYAAELRRIAESIRLSP